MGRFTLPDGWTKYDAIGDVIPGTMFIAFKVPLMMPYFNGKGLQRVMFTTTELCEKLGHSLRLVVDLSCKKVGMYYNPEDLESNGIRYVKLAVEGKKVPSEQVIKRFKAIVEDFESEQHPAGSFIGVHCTHGVNRTGYVISRYMIEHMSKSTEEALSAFETGRGYPLERENYIEALHSFERTLSGNDDAPKPEGNVSYSWSDYEGKNVHSKMTGKQRRRHHSDWPNSNCSSPWYDAAADHNYYQDHHPVNYEQQQHQQYINRPSSYRTHHHGNSSSQCYDAMRVDRNCYNHQPDNYEQQQHQQYANRPSKYRTSDNYHHHGNHRSAYKWRKGDQLQQGKSQLNGARSTVRSEKSHKYFH